MIQDGILPYLLEEEFREIEDIKQLVPVADVQICDDPSLIEQKILNGYVILTIETELKHLYPPRVTDMKDAIIRLPFQMQSKRPLFLRTKNPIRFSKKQALEKKDIDE